MKFCEKCESVIIQVGNFNICSNKKCGTGQPKSGYFQNRSDFVREKTTGVLVDKETGTRVVVAKKERKSKKGVNN